MANEGGYNMKIESTPLTDADILIQARKDKLQAIRNGHKGEILELLDRTIALFAHAAGEVAKRQHKSDE